MCIYEGKTYTSDVGRIINKYDIYVCDLGEMEENGLLGKKRPCVIVQSDKFNNPKSDKYIIAPIRTEHTMEVNRDTLQEIVESKKEVGRLYIPIECDKNDFRFIDMSQIRVIPSNKIQWYKYSILNEELKKKINDAMYEILISDDKNYMSHHIEKAVEGKGFKPAEESKALDIEEAHTEIAMKIEEAVNRYKGRESNDHLPKNFDTLYAKVKSGRMTTQKASVELGITTVVFNNLMKDYEKSLSKNNVDDVKNIPKNNVVTETNLKKKTYSKTTIPRGFSIYYRKYTNNEMSVKQIAEKLGRHVSTVYGYINKYEESNKELSLVK